ncbi:MAG: choice-of-anchor Q domain-containing protein, partial [Smithella sp.]
MKGSKILSQIGVIFVTCLLIFLYSQIVFAANYYVSPSGSGSTCSKESPCAPSGVPWSTVDDEESTVYLMGGTYTTSLDVIHTTASNRLYIKPCSASPDSTGCNGLVLFKLDATGDTVIWMGSATNTTIDGSKTSVDHTRNIKLDIGNNYGIAYNTGRSGNVIQYVEFTGMNGSGKYCIDAALQTSFETAYNYFHDNIGTAEMNVSGATASTYGAVKIHHNTVTAPTVNVVTGGGRGVDIYNNSFDLTDAAQTYDTIHILNNGIQYLRIYNNEFINNGELEDQTIFLENSTATGNKTQHVRIYNNVFRNSPTNTGGHCSIGIAIENADSAGGVDDFFILNNSFISTTGYFYPIRMYGSSSHMATYTNFKVENNIFKGAAKHILNEYVTWANEADAINDYNIFYHNTANHFAWLDGGGGSITTYTTVCASGCTWASNHPDYLHNKDMDPSYTSTSDLTLQVESPAINTGKDLSAYTDMDASWPADKDGNPRSGAWDIGAYQYGATNKSTLVVTSVNGTVASNPSGINCGSTCSADYESGTSVTLTASPNSGYTFAGWLGGGCSGTGTCTVTMNEATFVTANYTIPVYNLTVTKSGTGTGTVTGSDGLINCGS